MLALVRKEFEDATSNPARRKKVLIHRRPSGRIDRWVFCRFLDTRVLPKTQIYTHVSNEMLRAKLTKADTLKRIG